MQIISDGKSHSTKIIDDAGNVVKFVRKLTITIDAEAIAVQAIAEVYDEPIKFDDNGKPNLHTRLFWVKKLEASMVELEPERIKRREKALEEARRRFAERASQRIKERNAAIASQPKPQYDEVFEQGLNALDELAGLEPSAKFEEGNLKMTNENTRVQLWEAINRYAKACGGNTESCSTDSTEREYAVVAVEKAVAAIEKETVLKAATSIADTLKDRIW